MPRISSATRSGLIVMLVLLSALPAEAARGAFTIAEQLANESDLPAIGRDYELVSAGAVLYEHCAAEYKVDDAKKAHNDAQFAALSAAYMEGFSKAYQARTTKLPPDTVVAEYHDYIAKRQASAKINMLGSIKSRGCEHTALKRVDEYLEKKRQYQLEQQRSH